MKKKNEINIIRMYLNGEQRDGKRRCSSGVTGHALK